MLRRDGGDAQYFEQAGWTIDYLDGPSVNPPPHPENSGLTVFGASWGRTTDREQTPCPYVHGPATRRARGRNRGRWARMGWYGARVWRTTLRSRTAVGNGYDGPVRVSDRRWILALTCPIPVSFLLHRCRINSPDTPRQKGGRVRLG